MLKLIAGIVMLVLCSFVHPILGMLLFVMGFVMLIWSLVSFARGKTRSSAAFARGCDYVYEGGHTGIGVLVAERTLRLQNPYLTKEYGFSDVRPGKRMCKRAA